MGYELSIIRKKNYTDFEEESNISLEEWLVYVETDKELKLTNGFLSPDPTDDKWYDRPGFCEWVYYPNIHEHTPWFDFGYGSVTAKNPDDFTIKKMIAISKALNAIVVGDSEEFYDDTYFTNGGKPYFL